MRLFGGRHEKVNKECARLLERLDGRAVKYVAERDSETSIENVIGRTGRINTRNNQIAIVCDGTEVFRCSSSDADCGELLSLDGVVIKGINSSTGKKSIVVAYYQYYR